jgi:hypothetical protein
MSDTSTPALPKPARRFAIARPKVPPFARFKGTSAWRKDHRRAREYARFRAAEKQMNHSAAATNP